MLFSVIREVYFGNEKPVGSLNIDETLPQERTTFVG